MTTFPEGARKTIHVHQQNIKRGEPSVIVRTYKGSKHFTRVEVNGPSEIVHTQEPDKCGARVVIVTTAEVVGYRDWEVAACPLAS